MKRITLGIIVALVVALAGGQAWGQTTAQDLKDICKKNDTTCEMWVDGFLHGLGVPSLYRNLICVPQGVTVGQAKDVIVRHLKTHPEKVQQQAGVEAARALQEAFPCHGAKVQDNQ
jgi:hypothetical protein